MQQQSTESVHGSLSAQEDVKIDEEFFCKCNISSKINNILRSPQTHIRQKSVFTANPPGTTVQSKFNVCAKPFISSSQSSAKEYLQQTSPPSGTNHHSPLAYIQSPPYSYNNRAIRTVPSRVMYPYDDDLCRIPAMPPSFVPMHKVNIRSSREIDSSRSLGPVAMPDGTIQIRLRDNVKVYMTLDRAIRVVNQRSMVAISLSSNGSSSALIHPNGRVYQYGSKVEIIAYDGMKTNNFVRFAKMWYKGVSFTSDNCALTYLVDCAGTRTTSDSFTDMSRDYTIAVFYNDSRHGPNYAQEAAKLLQHANFECTDDGTEIFELNGFKISQTTDGLVKIQRNHNKCLIRTSPSNGSATLTTPIIHCTASLGKTSHLFVRRGDRRMHFDGSSFIVRNAGHSAGFDENNLLNVY
ncbi:hypothetical protein ACFFRR_009471 [Megaselia abdita]